MGAVELASGNVTLPNTREPWKLDDHKDNTFTITFVTSSQDVDLRWLNHLVGFERKYGLFVTPLPIRWAEATYYAAKEEYNQFKDWQREQDFIKNTA